MSYLHEDGQLILARWATALDAELPTPVVAMYGTPARAVPLVSNGNLGLDLIRLPAGGCFDPHTHPGDHLLIAVYGEGTITYAGTIYVTSPGTVYLIEGSVPHAVGAISDHGILAVGAPHRRADDADRMHLTEYTAVAAELGRLNCLACGREVEVGDPDCPHAPRPRERGKPLVVAPVVERPTLARLLNVHSQDVARVIEVCELAGIGEIPPGVVAAGLRGGGMAGRVVVGLGRATGQALGHGLPGDMSVFAELGVTGTGESFGSDKASYLFIYLNDHSPLALSQFALRLACTLAAAGPLNSEWSWEDARRFNDAIERQEVPSRG